MRTVLIIALLALPAASAVALGGRARPTPPLLVGGHAHGAASIRALAQLGMGNFVWIPKYGYGMGNTPWDDSHTILNDVDACKAAGMHFMVSQRRGLGPAFKPGGAEYGGDTTPEIHPPDVVREIRRRSGDLFVGLHGEELDADFLQNALRAGSRSRTPDLYRFTDRAGGRRAFEGELRRIAALAHQSGARWMPNLCVTLQHSGFRAGGDIVMAELLESLPNTELQLAYLRGGQSQFAKPWGVWVSPWHKGLVPVEDRKLWPGPNTAIGAGHPANRFQRCLALAWVSGARVLTMQETEPLFNRAPDGSATPAAWGRVLQQFWAMARQHPEPMEPIIPLALMVDRDSGWAPGHLHGDWIESQTVWGKLPPQRGDTMLARYLDALLPGFERKTGWWAPGGFEYPGAFAPSPAGAFDIVSSDITAARLARYRAVALMGEIAMTPALLRTLKAYARQGGRLHVNVNQFRLHEAFVRDPAFLGATIGETYQYSGWSKGNLLMRRTVSTNKVVLKAGVAGLAPGEWQEPWFVVQDVQPGQARVLATTGAGEPVLLRHGYGKGEVYLSTPDYLISGAQVAGERLSFFADLLLSIGRQSPVRITGTDGTAPPPDCSWVAARQGRDVVVALANHALTAAQATVTMEGSGTRAVTVAPESCVVLRWEGAAR